MQLESAELSWGGRRTSPLGEVGKNQRVQVKVMAAHGHSVSGCSLCLRSVQLSMGHREAGGSALHCFGLQLTEWTHPGFHHLELRLDPTGFPIDSGKAESRQRLYLKATQTLPSCAFGLASYSSTTVVLSLLSPRGWQWQKGKQGHVRHLMTVSTPQHEGREENKLWDDPPRLSLSRNKNL